MGDMTRPARINVFVNDLHNGFRLLNLKNDSLRKKCVGGLERAHRHCPAHTLSHARALVPLFFVSKV